MITTVRHILPVWSISRGSMATGRRLTLIPTSIIYRRQGILQGNKWSNKHAHNQSRHSIETNMKFNLYRIFTLDSIWFACILLLACTWDGQLVGWFAIKIYTFYHNLPSYSSQLSLCFYCVILLCSQGHTVVDLYESIDAVSHLLRSGIRLSHSETSAVLGRLKTSQPPVSHCNGTVKWWIWLR